MRQHSRLRSAPTERGNWKRESAALRASLTADSFVKQGYVGHKAFIRIVGRQRILLLSYLGP